MSDPLIGTQLGDYTIRSLLGRGGMARVYQGYDENLDRYAAVKIIETYLITGDDRDEYFLRFQREARAIARLQHPNIVSIYQFGKVDENYYMAMSFINGEDLRHILKRHLRNKTMMSHSLVLKVMRAMTEALDYAHKEGVIHRDIKPSNILVTEDGNAVLTDFGLALSVPEGTIGNTFGSAHYIAPEQAVSSAQAVPQSDLYSLGICLYEMLTGRVPFDDATAMSVALKHLSDPPPPPSQLNPDISPHVEEVILQVLEKEPEDRYESGAALMRALERAFALSENEDTHDLHPDASASKPKPPTQTYGTFGKQDSEDETAVPAAVDVLPIPRNDNTLASMPKREELGSQAPASGDVTKNRRANRRAPLLGLLAALLVVVLVGGIWFFLNPTSASVDPTPSQVSIAVAATEPVTEDDTEEAALSEVTTEIATELPATETPIPTRAATETPIVANETEAVAPPVVTVEATDEPTEPPTTTPTPSDVPVATAETAETEEPLPEGLVYIEARYDARTFVLFNNSGEVVDVGDLIFARARPNGGEVTFRATNWRANASQPPSVFPSQDCFQIWTTSFSLLPAEAYCDSRHSWRSVAPSRAFWLDDGDIMTFEVRLDEEVIATCEIEQETCQIPVPAN